MNLMNKCPAGFALFIAMVLAGYAAAQSNLSFDDGKAVPTAASLESD
jgi:hypothetical protein